MTPLAVPPAATVSSPPLLTTVLDTQSEPATGFHRRIECQPGAEYVHFAVTGDGCVARLAARNELEAARDRGAAREAAGGNNLRPAAVDNGGEDRPRKTNVLQAAAADRRVAVDGGARL